MKNKRPQKLIRYLFRAKELFHKELAGLSFEEKIKILVNLQKLVSNLGQGSKIVWQI